MEENATARRYRLGRMTHMAESVREGLVELLPRLRRFARTLTHHVHDADDLVQIAVERALVRAEQWQAGTRLDGWMFGIVRNAWIDEIRSRQRRSQLFAPEAAGEHVGAPGAGTEVEVLSVEAALSRLPEEQRTAITLVLIEGLSYKEAAESMQVPIGTLTSRLARGRDALQAILSESGGGAS
jgi:RNA polymerase sigma-70 factor, ECF subfamily